MLIPIIPGPKPPVACFRYIEMIGRLLQWALNPGI